MSKTSCHYKLYNYTSTVDWNLFATEFFCECLRTFEIAKDTIAKIFNGYTVFIVVMNFRKNFSIAKVFSIKVSWHFRKYF